MRTVIAGSTLVFARSLYRSAKDYADNKKWDSELFRSESMEKFENRITREMSREK